MMAGAVSLACRGSQDCAAWVARTAWIEKVMRETAAAFGQRQFQI